MQTEAPIPSRTRLVDILPRPLPDTELYNSILQAGFKQFPERKANYDKYRASQRGAKLDYLPIKMDIENVSRCNFRCTMCQVSDWKQGKRAEDMTPDQFKSFLLSQYGIVEIKLQGLGEPTLMGDPFFEMIHFARQRHIWVRTTTNTSLLHHKDYYRKLIDSDVSEVQISIDGATKESYEKIRRGGNFERAKNNCKLINDYARQTGKQRTKMWVVVQRDNFDQLELFPALAAEIGFDRLVFSLELTDWGQEKWRHINDEVYRGDSFDTQRAQKLIQLGKQHSVDVKFWFIEEKYSASDPAKLCPWPFERAYISSDMRIVPCCMIGNPEIFELGDARDFTAIWNSPQYQAFRIGHLKNKLPSICKNCYYKNTPS